MDGKKAILLMILCQINLLGLIEGATYKTFASMTASAMQSFPQVSTLQASPNQAYYLSLAITNDLALGMQCYAVETFYTAVVRYWGGVKMVGDYSAKDTCSVVLDDRGFVALQTYSSYLNVYDLSDYQKAHMADVQIYLLDDGSVVVLPDDSSNPSPPSTIQNGSTNSSPFPHSTNGNGPFRSSACLPAPLSLSALFLLICLFLQLPQYNA